MHNWPTVDGSRANGVPFPPATLWGLLPIGAEIAPLPVPVRRRFDLAGTNGHGREPFYRSNGRVGDRTVLVHNPTAGRTRWLRHPLARIQQESAPRPLVATRPLESLRHANLGPGALPLGGVPPRLRNMCAGEARQSGLGGLASHLHGHFRDARKDGPATGRTVNGGPCG
jgi:hypothetical protein